ncbi:ATP binding [Desmophyllum pertusum]|uniref:ATP binding n=1 Tax=Desmophyllum pertusum TaxID=174260 RepID=A0A9W9YJ09_9CNID|nr:ATP binding [Desmophyllum pertusum]
MRKGQKYMAQEDGRVYFYFEKLGFPSGTFRQVLSKYVNGLLNTKGGMLVFGVEPRSRKIIGCDIKTRLHEDLFRLEFDNEVRTTRPTVSPSLCRFVVTRLEDFPGLSILEIKIGAGPIGEMFMNHAEQVFVVRRRQLFGPLIPQEIKDLVIAKYREEITSTCNLLSPVPKEKESQDPQVE